DRNRSHWSTSKTPSYTKSVSWQHHQRRAKDKAHRKEVNNKILADLIKVGASEDVAKNIITAIVKGEVFATKITY
ncbi:hypothetical protein PO546_22860, partial [Escherichia coli]